MLILSMYDNEQFLFEALKAGASGYVLKSVADRDIVDACRAAMRGDCFLYPSANDHPRPRLLDRAAQASGPDDALTPREEEISNSSPKDTAPRRSPHILAISIKTVDRHRANILEKLGMRDRVELTRYAIRGGLIEP